VDALSPAELDEGWRRGRLPNLGRLRDAGLYGERCVAPFPSAGPAAVASLATGEFPARHGIAAGLFLDEARGVAVRLGREGGRVDLAARAAAIGGEHLSRRVRTIFEAAEAGGRHAACVNFPVCRGLRAHVGTPSRAMRILAGAPASVVVRGPRGLFLGDLCRSGPTDAARPLGGMSGPLARFGFNDDYAGTVLLELFERRAPAYDLVVARFPENARAVRAAGPSGGLEALEAVDGWIGRLFEAAGGLRRLLEERAVVVTAAGGASTVLPDDAARVDLAAALAELRAVEAGARRFPPQGAGVVIAPNGRAAILHAGCAGEARIDAIVERVLEAPGVEHALDVDARRGALRVRRRDGATLLFERAPEAALLPVPLPVAAGAPAAGGPGVSAELARARVEARAEGWEEVLDQTGERWRVRGDFSALALERDGGRVFSRRFPDPFRRIEGCLAGAPPGRIYLSAVPGSAFAAHGERFPAGGGAGGSLHAVDALVPLLVAGAGDGVPPVDLARTVDVAPLVLRLLGA
jgi:hypothetical protein